MTILKCTLANLNKHTGKYIFYFDQGRRRLGNGVQYDVTSYNIMARHVGGYFIPLNKYPSNSALKLLMGIANLFLKIRLIQQSLDSKSQP